MILETLLVQVDPGKYGWRATAIRMHPEDHWHTFVAFGGDDRHLSPLETEFAPGRFDMTGEDMMAKLVVLLGRPWREIMDDPTEVLGFQMRALSQLSDTQLKHIDNAAIEDIQDWVGDVNTLTEGEILRSVVTGDDALCLRN